MKTVFTFRPPRTLQEEMKSKYPEADFLFYKSAEEAERLHEAEVIVTFGDDLTPEHIGSCPHLKWIMVASAGIDHLPLQAIADRNILVTNARGTHKVPMAEFTMGFMLNHVKRFPELRELQKEETWNKQLPLGELAGKQLLVLGTGAIGSEIARLAQAFQMKTMGLNRSGHPAEHFAEVHPTAELAEVLPEADFVVAILPSTNETKGLLKEHHFQAMKETAAFINIGRGDIVEEQVLLDALHNECFAHAYLDVFIEEPLPAGHPFWKHPRVTVTPHISSITKQYLPRAFAILDHNLKQYIQGKSDFQNKIDLTKGY